MPVAFAEIRLAADICKLALMFCSVNKTSEPWVLDRKDFQLSPWTSDLAGS